MRVKQVLRKPRRRREKKKGERRKLGDK